MSVISDVLSLKSVVEDTSTDSARAKFSAFQGSLIYGDSRPEFRDGNTFYALKESSNQYGILKRIFNKQLGRTDYVFIIKNK